MKAACEEGTSRTCLKSVEVFRARTDPSFARVTRLGSFVARSEWLAVLSARKPNTPNFRFELEFDSEWIQ